MFSEEFLLLCAFYVTGFLLGVLWPYRRSHWNEWVGIPYTSLLTKKWGNQ